MENDYCVILAVRVPEALRSRGVAICRPLGCGRRDSCRRADVCGTQAQACAGGGVEVMSTGCALRAMV